MTPGELGLADFYPQSGLTHSRQVSDVLAYLTIPFGKVVFQRPEWLHLEP